MYRNTYQISRYTYRLWKKCTVTPLVNPMIYIHWTKNRTIEQMKFLFLLELSPLYHSIKEVLNFIEEQNHYQLLIL
jgi:hypothetical protein